MINVNRRMSELAELGAFSHNESLAVRNIADAHSAAVWLVACAIDVENVVEPPSYETALASRISNVSFAIYGLDKDISKTIDLWQSAVNSASNNQSIIDETRRYLVELGQLGDQNT